jgi:hypothetical protein
MDFVAELKTFDKETAQWQSFRYIEDRVFKAIRGDNVKENIALLDEIESSGVMEFLWPRHKEQFSEQIAQTRIFLSPESDDPFIRIQALYESHGVSVVPTKGAGRGFRHMVTAEYDGVPYAMEPRDGHGGINPGKAPHNMLHYRLTIERHHQQVKGVYEFLAKKTELGDVWAMIGGGSQLQVFFGNKSSYLAILYLTLESLDDQERLSENGYLAAVGNESFTLDIQSAKNNETFKGLNVPGVKVRKSTWNG